METRTVYRILNKQSGDYVKLKSGMYPAAPSYLKIGDIVEFLTLDEAKNFIHLNTCEYVSKLSSKKNVDYKKFIENSVNYDIVEVTLKIEKTKTHGFESSTDIFNYSWLKTSVSISAAEIYKNAVFEYDANFDKFKYFMFFVKSANSSLRKLLKDAGIHDDQYAFEELTDCYGIFLTSPTDVSLCKLIIQDELYFESEIANIAENCIFRHNNSN